MGAWGNGIFENDDAADWVGDLEVTPELVQQARAAVARMLAGSELLELWAEAGDTDLPEVHDLERRPASQSA